MKKIILFVITVLSIDLKSIPPSKIAICCAEDCIREEWIVEDEFTIKFLENLQSVTVKKFSCESEIYYHLPIYPMKFRALIACAKVKANQDQKAFLELQESLGITVSQVKLLAAEAAKTLQIDRA